MIPRRSVSERKSSRSFAKSGRAKTRGAAFAFLHAVRFSFLNSGKPKVEIENRARIFAVVPESVCPSPETPIANLLI